MNLINFKRGEQFLILEKRVENYLEKYIQKKTGKSIKNRRCGKLDFFKKICYLNWGNSLEN